MAAMGVSRWMSWWWFRVGGGLAAVSMIGGGLEVQLEERFVCVFN